MEDDIYLTKAIPSIKNYYLAVMRNIENKKILL